VNAILCVDLQSLGLPVFGVDIFVNTYGSNKQPHYNAGFT